MNTQQKVELNRQWRRNHPEYARKNYIRQTFGISEDEYESRLASQHNLCGACGEEFGEEYIRRPVLDHNHVTDELRLFVHDSCNKAIGFLRESPSCFRRLAEYLEKFDAKVTIPKGGGLPNLVGIGGADGLEHL